MIATGMARETARWSWSPRAFAAAAAPPIWQPVTAAMSSSCSRSTRRRPKPWRWPTASAPRSNAPAPSPPRVPDQMRRSSTRCRSASPTSTRPRADLRRAARGRRSAPFTRRSWADAIGRWLRPSRTPTPRPRPRRCATSSLTKPLRDQPTYHAHKVLGRTRLAEVFVPRTVGGWVAVRVVAGDHQPAGSRRCGHRRAVDARPRVRRGAAGPCP